MAIHDLPDAHPARRFLKAFAECRRQCVGRELDPEPIDQSWESAIDGKTWTFSAFAYAFLSFDVVLDDWTPNAPRLTRSKVDALATIPIARALLEELLSHGRSRSSRKVLLEVRASNTGAIALYGRLGFEQFNVRRGYYADNEDAVEMSLVLKTEAGSAG